MIEDNNDNDNDNYDDDYDSDNDDDDSDRDSHDEITLKEINNNLKKIDDHHLKTK